MNFLLQKSEHEGVYQNRFRRGHRWGPWKTVRQAATIQDAQAAFQTKPAVGLARWRVVRGGVLMIDEVGRLTRPAMVLLKAPAVVAQAQAMVDAQPAAPTCPACQDFFSRFRCAAADHLECDCPRCQGLCSCLQIPNDEKSSV